MRDSVRFRLAIHDAKSAEEIGDIVRSFFKTLTEQDRRRVSPALLSVATFSDSVVGQKALEAARAELMAGKDGRDGSVLTEVSAVLSAAALRLSVIELESGSKAPGRSEAA
jgi:hypothetical protein